MKYLGLILLCTIYMLVTMLLAFSLIGLVVITVRDRIGEVYWFSYGEKILALLNYKQPQ